MVSQVKRDKKLNLTKNEDSSSKTNFLNIKNKRFRSSDSNKNNKNKEIFDITNRGRKLEANANKLTMIVKKDNISDMKINNSLITNGNMSKDEANKFNILIANEKILLPSYISETGSNKLSNSNQTDYITEQVNGNDNTYNKEEEKNKSFSFNNLSIIPLF